MLKIYKTLDEVPEALREHYTKSDGQYVPQLSDDHPVLVHNKTLLAEKSAATSKLREAEADLEHAKSTSLPRGHVAVAKADAQLLDEVKALGKVEDIKAALAEHETLKTDLATRKRADTLRSVAGDLGYNADAFVLLPNLPDFESREGKDGKQWFAKVKDEKGVVTERLASEFVEGSDAIKPLLPALKTAGQDVQVPGSGGGGTGAGKDPFASAKEFAKNWNESAKAGTDVESRFGVAKSA
jgi:hypothetical protein